jgi:hypothetical protein
MQGATSRAAGVAGVQGVQYRLSSAYRAEGKQEGGHQKMEAVTEAQRWVKGGSTPGCFAKMAAQDLFC